MTDLNEIIADVKKRIQAACVRSGRDEGDVGIIAVTKTHGEETVREAWGCGLGMVGENKVQEAAWKKANSISGPEWHLIGHLQGNKVRPALEIFDFFHSVDSVKLLRRINAVAEETGASPRILLEVNVSGEKSKTGMKIEEVDEAVRTVMEECPRITLEGFMTMAPFSENPEDSRPYFRRLRLLRDEVQERFSISLPRLSMGMSGDYEVAIEEGATWIRLGTVLFGERPKIKRAAVAADDECPSGGLDSYSGEGPTCRILD